MEGRKIGRKTERKEDCKERNIAKEGRLLGKEEREVGRKEGIEEGGTK